MPRLTHLSQAEAISGSILYSPPKTVLIQIVIVATMISNTIFRSDYVEVYTASDNNATHPRTVTAVSLHPAPESLKEWTFYSLESGKTLTDLSSNAFSIPWSRSVVDRLNIRTVCDPICGHLDFSIGATDLNYVPQYIQPLLPKSGSPQGSRNQ